MGYGFAVFCPHLSARMPGNEAIDHETWIENDLPWVEAADAVFRIDGESVGADIEESHADLVGVPVYRETVALLEDFSDRLDRTTDDTPDIFVQCPPVAIPSCPLPVDGMHDSGKREAFHGGAVRDAAEDKPRPDLVSPFAMERLGEWLRKGAEKYEDRNWEKGIPISRCMASLVRHVLKYQQGESSEDHMAAVMCNAMFILHMEEMVERSVLPMGLADMPSYEREDG
jgi:hypothetical protein